MSVSIKIALEESSNVFKHIDNIPKNEKGLSCGCICLRCNEKLQAVIDVTKKAKHFRHHTNLNCTGSQETALHELGKQIIVENRLINIPKHGFVEYSNPIAERRHETRKPDVSVIYNERDLFFEIFVKHAVDKHRATFFINGKHRCVEIDLSKLLNSTFEEIQEAVLNQVENKTVIFWDNEELIPQTEALKQEKNIWGLIITIALVFLSAKHFLKKQKRKTDGTGESLKTVSNFIA